MIAFYRIDKARNKRVGFDLFLLINTNTENSILWPLKTVMYLVLFRPIFFSLLNNNKKNVSVTPVMYICCRYTSSFFKKKQRKYLVKKYSKNNK